MFASLIGIAAVATVGILGLKKRVPLRKRKKMHR